MPSEHEQRRILNEICARASRNGHIIERCGTCKLRFPRGSVSACPEADCPLVQEGPIPADIVTPEDHARLLRKLVVLMPWFELLSTEN